MTPTRTPTRASCRRGSVMVEFTLSAIPLLFVTISLFWMGMGMWQYHTLAEAVNETARYAALHGADCVGQACSTTVEQIANILAGRAAGIPPGLLNVTLTSAASGGTVTCNPLTSCQSNSAAWPTMAGNTAVGDSSAGTDISISATYQFRSPIAMWVPTNGKVQFGTVTLGANSTQPVLY
jgi:Flp pilus assembly protein TadG